jgi:hypothetical protein
MGISQVAIRHVSADRLRTIAERSNSFETSGFMTAIPHCRPQAVPALLSAGFRPFFLLGALWSSIAVPLWLMVFSGQGGSPPSSRHHPADGQHAYRHRLVRRSLRARMSSGVVRFPRVKRLLLSSVAPRFAGFCQCSRFDWFNPSRAHHLRRAPLLAAGYHKEDTVRPRFMRIPRRSWRATVAARQAMAASSR